MMPPRHPLRSTEVPQADSLENVRHVLDALAHEARSTREISEQTGIGRRHVDYALNTARTLGWLSRGEDRAISVSGLEMLATAPGSTEERARYRRAIRGSEVLQRLASDLLDASPPGKEILARRICRAVPELSEKTALRRAQALLAWRTQALPSQLDLFSIVPAPDTASPPQAAPPREDVAPPSDSTIAPRFAGGEDSAARPDAVPSPTNDARAARAKLEVTRGGAPAQNQSEPVAAALPLFPEMRLPDHLQRDLLRSNPWWHDEPSVALPRARRDFVETIHKRLSYRLAPIVVVRGPRQVGKTTAQLQVIADLLQRGVPARHILRVQCDEIPALNRVEEPVLRIVDWYEAAVLRRTLNAAAHAGEPTYLFFDEVQNLPDWAVQLKYLVDSSTTQVVVTGSSALRIEAGRDSLAGRINTIEVGTLTLREISRIRFGEELAPLVNGSGIDSLASAERWRQLRKLGARQAELRDQAFAAFSSRGGYPLMHARAGAPWPELADQLNETIIRRVIQHDLRLGDRGRKRDPQLLEEIFRLSCRYAGQSPGLDLLAKEAQRALRANIGVHRVRHYLDFLDRTLLPRTVKPLELRLKRTQGAPKLCLADHGLRASWLQEVVPLSPRELSETPELATLAGHLAESITGAYLLNVSGLDLAHFPERGDEPEVDFVITVGTRRIPVEIKYRKSIHPLADTRGLCSFIERKHYNAPFGLLVTQSDTDAVSDPRIITLPLSSLLLLY